MSASLARPQKPFQLLFLLGFTVTINILESKPSGQDKRVVVIYVRADQITTLTYSCSVPGYIVPSAWPSAGLAVGGASHCMASPSPVCMQ